MFGMKFGHDMIAKVDVTFVSGQRPVGALVGPSTDRVADKTHFGSSQGAALVRSRMGAPSP